MSKLQLTTGNDKGDRRELDFYPTPPEVTIALMNFLNLEKSNVWECACGDGAMSKVLQSYGHNVFSSDIDTHYGLSNTNFLETRKEHCDWIITNPPFNLSQAFIEHALSMADNVAMLVKSQYWHAKKRVELFEKHKPSWVLPLTWRPDFLGGEKGGSPTMEVIWTVWMKNNTNAQYQPLLKPITK